MAGLLSVSDWVHASWARMTDAELIAQSDVIVVGELVGETRVKLQSERETLRLGVISVQEVLKGDPNQNIVLLVLPSQEGLRLSAEILYHKGQRGLWFLRLRSAKEVGLYVADHPQRFLSPTSEAQRIEAFRDALGKRGGRQ